MFDFGDTGWGYGDGETGDGHGASDWLYRYDHTTGTGAFSIGSEGPDGSGYSNVSDIISVTTGDRIKGSLTLALFLEKVPATIYEYSTIFQVNVVAGVHYDLLSTMGYDYYYSLYEDLFTLYVEK